MKKIISAFLAAMLIAVLPACESSASGNSLAPGSSDPGSVDTNAGSGSDTPAPQIPEAVTVEEAVLLDEDDIKITAAGFAENELFGPALKLLIENNSQTDLTVQVRNASVNGYMTETMMSVDVAAGKKANDSLTFMSSSLEACGIETVADMEFQFHIFDSDSWDAYLDSSPITLTTSAAENFEYVYDDTGVPVYDGNGIKIVAKGISEDDSIFGPGLVLYLYNSGGENVTVQARDTSVNGFMITPIFSQDILPGKRAIASVTFMSSDLEDNGITEITDIELSFHIFDADSWNTIVDTDPVSLTF